MGRHSGGPLTADERRIIASWSAESHNLLGIQVPTGELLASLAASSAGRANLRALIARHTVSPKPTPRPYPTLATHPRDELAEARFAKALERLKHSAAQ